MIGVERCVKKEENSLKVYQTKSGEKLLESVAKAEKLNVGELEEIRDLKLRKENEVNDRWIGKRMHGEFVRDLTDKIDKEKIWGWLPRCDLKVGTEAPTCAASIRTNYMKYYIEKTAERPLCRMCGQAGETIQHIVSACGKLAQKKYKRRHDNVARKIHWDKSIKRELKCSDK